MLGWTHTDGVDEVRDLARRGLLAGTIASACDQHRLRLTGATYAIVWPVVYGRLTRRIELRRGHVTCAASVSRLTDDCLDRFENDVEAVVEDVTHRAGSRIDNLEGWIASRLVPATVDGHRRRRGEIGALQRPRVPGWLAAELDDDAWLIDLATQMLIWAGTTATAGYDLWPTASWAVRRCERLGGWSAYGEADVHADIRVVQRAMRTRPQWYDRYVEGPLGRKQPPVASAPQHDDSARAGTPDGREDTLAALAHDAVATIQTRLRHGEPARAVVQDVLSTIFGADAGAPADRPGAGGRAYEDPLDRMLRDPAGLDRLVATVLTIVSAPGDD
ncbi:hypothetical protein J2S43_001654 [Catenuloplanes nepalensis]|uniref:Uncharacterized protein n=1 Tax=Catenuloplanes nepalensis TaxID=587533 RepID=A0ABT9MP14_9ACTN|nr:hypothetical protein [Catenuloplanes nepalensis]MDP9793142.1 hypothetical protein [Catenuloplanes nepalensis]